MKKLVAIFCAVAVMILSLAGCAGKTSSTSPAAAASTGTTSTKSTGEVNVYNWGEYIDESVLADFQKQTGIKVNYTTFSDNESMYAVLKMGGSNYDVIIPSDYMISRMIGENMLEKLDYANIPNYSQIDDKYKKQSFDPTDEYSVPYTTGTVGIIYNSKMISDTITSWNALFDSKYAGKILMFGNQRDAMAIALLDLGYSVNTTNADELNKAYEVLAKQKPLVQAYVMDQIFDKLESGEAAIGPYYAGDYVTMKESNPDLKFVLPKEGANQFVDSMCVPKGAGNKKNAELFINFMCSKDVSLKNMAAIGYTTPNKDAATDYAKQLDADTAAIMFPEDAVLKRCQVFTNLPTDTLSLYDSLWAKLKS